MENKQIVCVDLGTSKLGISVAKVGKAGKIEVSSYAEYPSNGIVHAHLMSSEKLKMALKYAIEQVESAQGIKVNELVVSAQKYGVKLYDVEASLEITSGKSISKEDIENLSNLAWDKAAENKAVGEDVIGLVPQSYNTEEEWNVNPSDIIGMRGHSLSGKFKAFLANESLKANLDDTLREIGYATAKIRFAPDAIGRSVLFANEMASGVALIDFGAGATSVSIFEGGVLRHYGSIPFGGDCITGDIRSICDIPEKMADSIKMGFGGCMPARLGELGEKTLRIADGISGRKKEITAKYLSEIITARVAEIIDAMLYEIQKSGYADSLKCGIVLCGGCADMLNIKTFIQERSGYTTRIGSPNRNSFDAPVFFYRPEVSASAGLIEDNVYDVSGNFIDIVAKQPAGSIIDLFQEESSPKEKVQAEVVEQPKDNGKRRSGSWFDTIGGIFGGETSEQERKRREEEQEQQRQEKLRKEQEKVAKAAAKKEEEERRKQEKQRLKEQKQAEKKNSAPSLFDNIFGNDDDPKNII